MGSNIILLLYESVPILYELKFHYILKMETMKFKMIACLVLLLVSTSSALSIDDIKAQIKDELAREYDHKIHQLEERIAELEALNVDDQLQTLTEHVQDVVSQVRRVNKRETTPAAFH